MAFFIFLQNSLKLGKWFNLHKFGIKWKLRRCSNIYQSYFGDFWSFESSRSVLGRKMSDFCQGGWIRRSRRLNSKKILSPLDSAGAIYYIYQFSASLEQKNIHFLKNFVAFQFLRRLTANFQNGQIWNFFFSKCS